MQTRAPPMLCLLGEGAGRALLKTTLCIDTWGTFSRGETPRNQAILWLNPKNLSGLGIYEWRTYFIYILHCWRQYFMEIHGAPSPRMKPPEAKPYYGWIPKIDLVWGFTSGVLTRSQAILWLNPQNLSGLGIYEWYLLHMYSALLKTYNTLRRYMGHLPQGWNQKPSHIMVESPKLIWFGDLWVAYLLHMYSALLKTTLCGDTWGTFPKDETPRSQAILWLNPQNLSGLGIYEWRTYFALLKTTLCGDTWGTFPKDEAPRSQAILWLNPKNLSGLGIYEWRTYFICILHCWRQHFAEIHGAPSPRMKAPEAKPYYGWIPKFHKLGVQ